jgi:exosortase
MKPKYLSLFIWIASAILFAPIFLQLYQSRWEYIDYTHAYFILPISLYIVWSKRGLLSALTKEVPRTSWVGLFLILLGAGLFLLGWREEYLVVASAAMIPLFAGIVLFVYGGKVLGVVAFPISYLLFLLPPPLGVLDAITLPMRYGISAVVAKLLTLMGYPLVREGLLLTMGGREIYMGEPCSGFRSLITLLSLGIVYIYTLKGTIKKKLFMSAFIIPFALLGNVLRVMILCFITYYLGAEMAEGVLHDASGILMFLILIFCLIGLERVIDRKGTVLSSASEKDKK